MISNTNDVRYTPKEAARLCLQYASCALEDTATESVMIEFTKLTRRETQLIMNQINKLADRMRKPL